MYCGTNKTARSSQCQIAEALITLMRRKPFSTISISEICRLAGVSRQTFYSLFGTKEDVISYVLAESYGYSMDSENVPDDTPLERMCRGYSRYIVSQQQFLELLVQNNIGYLLQDSIAESLLHCECFLIGRPATAREYAANFTAGGISGVVRQYIVQQTAPESLSRILMELFSGEIFL